MSEDASPFGALMEMPEQRPTQPQPASRSMAQRVIRRTFSGWGARLGIAWIGIVSFCAIFAPFIASSFPYLAKIDGHWSSPLLEHLTPADVILVIAALIALALWPIKTGFGRKAGIVTWAIAVLIPAASWASIAEDWHLYQDSFRPIILWPLTIGLCVIDAWAIFFFFGSLRLSTGLGKSILSLMGLVVILLILFPVRPSEAVDYAEYRDLARAGKIQEAWYAPIRYSGNDRLRDFPDRRLTPPTRDDWFGTDSNGADVLARIIHACRIASAIGFIATSIAIAIGIIVGGAMGYFVGKVDILGMRLVEVFEAIPTLFLLISFVAFFGRNLYLIMAIIGLTTWTYDARFVRGEFLRLRNQDFVQAAIAAGLPLRSIIFRHMLPNGLAPVLVSASFGVAWAILYESILSFLGLGLVDEPSWGQLLNQALGSGGTFQWWVAIFPGMAIFLTVFAYNLIGEALRDALDPRLVQI